MMMGKESAQVVPYEDIITWHVDVDALLLHIFTLSFMLMIIELCKLE
jgi:hypothetical protein